MSSDAAGPAAGGLAGSPACEGEVRCPRTFQLVPGPRQLWGHYWGDVLWHRGRTATLFGVLCAPLLQHCLLDYLPVPPVLKQSAGQPQLPGRVRRWQMLCRERGKEEGVKGQREEWATVSRCPGLKSRSPISAWGAGFENRHCINAQTKPSNTARNKTEPWKPDRNPPSTHGSSNTPYTAIN